MNIIDKNKKIFDLIKKLEFYFSNNLNLLKITLPRIQDFDINNDSINFDNYTNYKVYQFCKYHDNYQFKIMSENVQNSNYNGIFSKFFQVNRDIEINDSISIIEDYYDLCIKMNSISKINFQSEIEKYENELLSLFNFKKQKIKFKSISNFDNKLIPYNIDDYLFEITHSNKLINIIHSNVKNKYLGNFNFEHYDLTKSTTLLYWYDNHKCVIPIMDFWVLKDSLLNEDNHYTSYIKIRIHLSKLLAICMKAEKMSDISF